MAALSRPRHDPSCETATLSFRARAVPRAPRSAVRQRTRWATFRTFDMCACLKRIGAQALVMAYMAGMPLLKTHDRRCQRHHTKMSLEASAALLGMAALGGMAGLGGMNAPDKARLTRRSAGSCSHAWRRRWRKQRRLPFSYARCAATQAASSKERRDDAGRRQVASLFSAPTSKRGL